MRYPTLVAGSLAALLLAVAPLAQAAPPAPAAQATASRVEQRIQALRDKLKITPMQEAEWNAVAEAMREDAAQVGALIRERQEKAETMDAVQDMRSYRAIAEAHAEGVAKLTAAFEVLYAVMSPEQRKSADEVFDQAMRRRAARREAK